MRFADTAVHVYHRPTAWPALRGSEGAMQLALGLVQALVFVALLWLIGAFISELA